MRVNFASPNPSGEVLMKFICLDLGVLVVPVCFPWALLYTLVIYLANLRICHVLGQDLRKIRKGRIIRPSSRPDNLA
jgi:hypothetical protein